jgi:cell division protein FtsZ
MGTGTATGSARAMEAANKAISHPLLEDISIRGARGILINISSNPESFTMDELREVCMIIQNEAHEDALIKWGLVYDDSLSDELRVTVIATGIGGRAEVDRERLWQAPVAEPLETAQDLDIPAFMRKGGEIPRAAEAGGDRRLGSAGTVPGKRYIVHPDLQYEESELDTPPFLRKAD